MKRHSYLSPKCSTQRSPIHGWGIFAKQGIARGEMIALWGGVVYSMEEVTEIAKHYPHFETHTVSIYKDFYLGPLDTDVSRLDEAELFNHSCDPNAGVKEQIVIVARRPILQGEEVCFDYDTTEIEAVPFVCRCRTPQCRGLIDGSAWKNASFRVRHYGYLSWYIEELIRQESEGEG
jgi:SET domain-containing protein